jgi:DNA modification methylase
MPERKQPGLGDELFGTPMAAVRDAAGPTKGEFVAPPEVPDVDEAEDALPEQEDFWRPPARFGTVPVEANPLGWDRRRGFRKLYPQVMLPTQVVERVTFGHPELEPNRLFWGDNLHVMRQLPSEGIDLIYIDPPFFSGKLYNVLFGDQNELRSFEDIWQAGLPGYLIWLNARLYEMKRLLRKTGSIFVHLDWHAAHYVKAEMDKVFGAGNFVNEIVWCYEDIGGKAVNYFKKKHDSILYYQKSAERRFNISRKQLSLSTMARYAPYLDTNGQITYRRLMETNPGVFKKLKGIPEDLDQVWLDVNKGPPLNDWWTDISPLKRGFSEAIGYPTQKPEALLERIVNSASSEGEVVADFFVGGGTTAAVAQRLGRRWLACDQSRVAVAITADRLARVAEQMPLEAKSFVAPDFTIEHWAIYEAKRLAQTPPDQFREFVLRAFAAVPDVSEPGIHGHKGAVPVWVGQPDERSQVTARDVQDFANAVRKTVRYQQDNLRDGIMLAWAFRPDAVQAADRLREMEATELNFIRLDLIRIGSPRFREHVHALSTDRADYSTFLTFVQPPKVEVGWRKVGGRMYKFDVSETVVLNAGAKVINVQWDFDYRDHFTSTQGYSFVRTAKKEPALQVDYTFPALGRYRIACKVQDDAGGEGVWVGELEVA